MYDPKAFTIILLLFERREMDRQTKQAAIHWVTP